MRYLITGATGFIGKKLVNDLLKNDQNKIIILSRSRKKAEKIFGRKVWAIENLDEIKNDEKINYIINLAGEGIASKRWSKEQKQILIDSRVNITQNIYQLVGKLKTKPRTLINASAIGFYGSCADEELDENSPAKSEFTSKLCSLWEGEAKEIENLGVRVCILRFGIVLGKNGGALAKMLPAFKIGLGGRIGSGKQFMSWVHIDDVIGVINFVVLNENLSGVFNVTSPNAVCNSDFTKTLARTLDRPAIFNMPSFVVALLFGQMGKALLLEGQKVLPKRLMGNGFEFKFLKLDNALKDCLLK